MKISSAQIVCVGTELLLGDIVNTNEAYIAARLRELGVPLYRSTSVGDNPERLKAVIGEAIASFDLVITTGGLGPTDDDLTKETVTDLLGLVLVHDAEAEENISARLRGGEQNFRAEVIFRRYVRHLGRFPLGYLHRKYMRK